MGVYTLVLSHPCGSEHHDSMFSLYPEHLAQFLAWRKQFIIMWRRKECRRKHIPLDQSNYRAWSLTPGLLSQPTYSWHPHLHPPPCHHCSPCVRPWWDFWHPFLSISNERSLCNKTAPLSHKDVAVFPSVFSNTVAYISINAHSKLNWGQWSLFFSITNVYQ